MSYDAKDAEACRKVAAELEKKMAWTSSPRGRQVILHLIRTNLETAERIEQELRRQQP